MGYLLLKKSFLACLHPFILVSPESAQTRVFLLNCKNAKSKIILFLSVLLSSVNCEVTACSLSGVLSVIAVFAISYGQKLIKANVYF
jgi:hypothetical protein